MSQKRPPSPPADQVTPLTEQENGVDPRRPRVPRQPHERDESPDSQQGYEDARIEQAHDDLENGLVDTDRRGPGDQSYVDR
ncbi:hypothetical protein [Gulbenkiania mobilis]|uniref:Uncharacterized protein n=1 Tax=Gulbenkiania mobilis TaxID=397457 RepID=A0ABY2D0Q1_GULMO|nr:hypothetical protein [Gulbenkiania mobilis]TCW33850.1 hypothetical protein EV669_101387 [Gulbenkiania mobilis]